MKHVVSKYHRRSIRLKGYDYTQRGIYFVTICTFNRQCLFGEILDGKMRLNEWGQIVLNEWERSAVIRPEIQLDKFVVMPNHVHGIIVLNDDGRGTARRAPTREQFGKPVAHSVPTIIRSFKSAVTKYINEIQHVPNAPIWQRNYYEHIIRDENEFNRVRQYIIDNPAQWENDRNNPSVPMAVA